MNSKQAMSEIIEILNNRPMTNMQQFIAISHVADKYRFGLKNLVYWDRKRKRYVSGMWMSKNE
jgi:hypothetical protein